MDLTERIARLIDPDSWETVDRGEAIGLPSAQVFVNDSIATARRVIDGLGLIPDHRDQFNGHRWTEPAADRYVTPWAEQPIDDTPPTQAVADEMRARIDQITQAKEDRP